MRMPRMSDLLRIQVLPRSPATAHPSAKSVSIRMKELQASVTIEITPQMTSLQDVIAKFHELAFATPYEEYSKQARLLGIRAHPLSRAPQEVPVESLSDLLDDEVLVYRPCDELRTLVEQGCITPLIATRLSNDSSAGSLSPTYSPSMKRKGRCPSVANNAERVRRYAPLLEKMDLSPRERGQIQTLLLDGDDQIVAAMEQCAATMNPAHVRRALQGRPKVSVENLSHNFSTMEMHSPVPTTASMMQMQNGGDEFMQENPFLTATASMAMPPASPVDAGFEQEVNPFMVAPSSKPSTSRGRFGGSSRPSLAFDDGGMLGANSPFVFLHSIKEKTTPPNARSNLSLEPLETRAFDERVMELFCVQDLLDNVPVARNFQDCYTVGHTLGTGRYSVVKQCRHLATDEIYAVKIIDKRQTTEVRFLKRELEIMHDLHHDGVVQLKELFESTNEIYVVMELCSQELFEYIDIHGPLEESIARRLIARLVTTVAYLHHKCIVHRDIKPENILLSGTELWDIKLSDFGIARKLEGANCTLTPHESLSEVANLHEQALDVHSNVRNRTGRAHTKCGTRDYVAPEVMSGKGYGTEADLWSVGVVTYVLLSGCAPVFLPAGDGTKKLAFAEECWNDMSEEARSFIETLLVRNPEQRSTALEALDHAWLQHVQF